MLIDDATMGYSETESKLMFHRIKCIINRRGARGVMVIVVGNGHDNTSSNPGRDWLHFT